MSDRLTTESDVNVTVTFTAPQVRVLNEALSMIEADPDWIAMLGGQRQMDTLYRAHNRILLAKRATPPVPESGGNRG